MATHCVVDFNNIIQRAKHVVKIYDTPEEYVGTIMSIVFNSLRKSFNKFNADHAVMCMDSYSWRNIVYPLYKANRKIDKADASESDLLKHHLTKQVMRDLGVFLKDYTNVTVLEEYGVEADDFIARWVQRHPNDEHVIVSADGDFKQLVRDNVELYNPLSGVMYTPVGVFYQPGGLLSGKFKGGETIQRYGEDWRVKLDKQGEPERCDPEWELFFKCIRGDVSDNIKSSFPRVSVVRMRAALNARHTDPLIWNNFLNEEWGEDRVRVGDRYEFNRSLIDLTNQPEEIIGLMDEVIDKEVLKEQKRMVSIYFQKFCSKYGLDRVSQGLNTMVPLLSYSYQKAKNA